MHIINVMQECIWSFHDFTIRAFYFILFPMNDKRKKADSVVYEKFQERKYRITWCMKILKKESRIARCMKILKKESRIAWCMKIFKKKVG